MLKSRIPRIVVELDLVLDEAIEAGAEQVAAEARQRLEPHRRSGDLERSVHIETEQEGVYVVAGDEDVFWGHLLEHGTTHSPPHPFLVSSLEDNRDDILRLAQAGLRRL